MFDNLRYSGAVVDAKTRAGEMAVQILDLNDPEAVGYREFVIDSVDIAEEKKSRLLKQQSTVEQRLKKGSISQAVATAATSEIAAELTKVEKILKRLSGRF